MTNAFFLVFIAVVFAADFHCPKYICETDKSYCARRSYDINNIMNTHLNPCTDPTNSICEIPTGLDVNATCKEEIKTAYRYPGEYCTNDYQCLGSRKCIKNVCLGISTSTKCKADYDCSARLFCKNGICAKTRALGQDCSDSIKCGANMFCLNNECVLKMSIENGKDATVPAQCKSYFMVNGKCAQGPTLELSKNEQNENTTECIKGKCTYKYIENNKEKIFTTPCSCGMTSDGKSYCNRGLGDIDLSSLSEYLKDGGDASKCHISKGPLCQTVIYDSMPTSFHKAFVAYAEMENDAIYQNNPTCVKTMINNNYWTSKSKDSEVDSLSLYFFIGILVGIILIVVVILIIIGYKKSRRCNEDDFDEKTLKKKVKIKNKKGSSSGSASGSASGSSSGSASGSASGSISGNSGNSSGGSAGGSAGGGFGGSFGGSGGGSCGGNSD